MTANPSNIAAVYGRYSSDQQDDASLDSQVEKCKAFALSAGLTIPDDLIFTDAAVSGRSSKRDSYQRMISMAKDKPARFSTVLVWKFSRLARNREEAILVKSLLRRQGIAVRSVSEPVDTDSAHGKLMEGILECLDEFYSANLAAETRRGQEQATTDGFWCGGRPPYGYKLKKVPDPKGRTGKGGEAVMRTILEVDPLRARVVRDIFTWSSQGVGLRRIAERLNDAAVPPPAKGRGFDPSAIRGMLKNETYRGKLIHNRRAFFRKPNGGKTRRDNPRSEWIINDIPELRIIDEELWQAVADRFAEPSRSQASTNHRELRYPFSGMIRCATCNANFIAIRATRKGHSYVKYACGYNHRRGSSVCANQSRVDQNKLMDAVVGAIEEHILKEPNIKIIVDAVEKLVAEYRGNHSDERKRLQAERDQLDKEIENLSRAMSIAKDVPELAKQLQDKAKRRSIVADALDGLNNVIRRDLLDGLEEKVRAKVQNIRDVLSGADVHELRSELKRHITSIVVDDQGQMRIEGALTGALEASLKMVAGAGLEPATSRL